MRIHCESFLVYLVIERIGSSFGAEHACGIRGALRIEIKMSDNCKSLKILSLSLNREEKDLEKMKLGRPSTKL